MKKQKSSIWGRLFMAAASLGVLAYFVFQALNYVQDPLTTTLAYPYQVEVALDLSGFVVRNEQVLSDSAAGGLLRIQRAEGERVSVGGTVAEVYEDQASLERQLEADSLSERLEQLQYAQSLTKGTVTKLDEQITRRILDYRRYVTSDRLYDAEDVSSELRALVMRRDYSEVGDDLPMRIQQLQMELESLQSQATNSVRRITAPTAGLYSAESDGFEVVLTPESLQEMTPSKLAVLRADTSSVSRVGKLILGDEWFYAAVMSAEELSMLEQRLEESKGSLYLRFAKGVDRDLPVTLSYTGPAEGDQVVAVFRGSTYLRELTLLRQQRAQIIYDTAEGIRIPKAALRAERTAKDSEGNLTTESTAGVYCLVGREARFKPVEIIYSGDNYVLVRSPAKTDDKLLIRSGEEIVVSAKNIYDRKVIQ